MLTVDEIRELYLNFFKKKNHPVIASDSLVPHNDPSLLFTGAGMNQFKDNFLGVNTNLKRATSSQKCLRTGDLDEVGRTPYHHSFFEMLGNFSFGDYFKKEAIEYAWEFLTVELKIPKEKFRISVHESDQEAFDYWKNKIGVPENWIYKMGDKSNFWPSNAPKDGPNGPCGPCSEIYYDQGPEYIKDPTAHDLENGRFTEIWNLVFTQFDRRDGGILNPLAQKNIDTGMGLERLACVLQGKKTNYEIDTFQKINALIEKTLNVSVTDKDRMNLYAISDHLRATVVAMADGVIPSNEGRGYVIRKLIRRALWHAKEISPQGIVKEPFLYRIVKTVAEVMRKPYPEIMNAAESVSAMLKSEEERFLNTLDTGLGILNQRLSELKSKKSTLLPGSILFELYDTYGFPEELTRRIAEREGFQIDHASFEKLMEEQRKRAKDASQISSEIFVTSELEKIAAKLPATKFLGYDSLSAKGRVLHAELKESQGILILDQTPFYAESGGQVGDRGLIRGSKFEAAVADTQKIGFIFVHYLEAVSGEIKTGDVVDADIDAHYRFNTMRNHTATHLLHAALRQLLGNQVRQLGSLVAPDRLRFDYSYSSALTAEQVREIENQVNGQIWANSPVTKIEKDLESAKKEGAMAFFGEKYGDKVRVVAVENFSKELCGGTHCDRTGQIGFFVITSESSIASGTRRIEAKTGESAMEYVRNLRDQVEDISQKLKTTPAEIGARIIKLQETIKKLEKDKSKVMTAQLSPKTIMQNSVAAGNYLMILYKDKELHIDQLRSLSDTLRAEAQKTVYFIVSEQSDKIHGILGASGDLKNSSLDLRDLWKQLAPDLGASGGGRKDMIQVGGKNEGQLENNWKQISDKIGSFLKKIELPETLNSKSETLNKSK
ncbi:MAG: alanine--tRNA ligase [Candidatus Omnitrophica bacterium]|nr:alanine--tRNA ligase [Candidatus Omnitrophota bacterium]